MKKADNQILDRVKMSSEAYELYNYLCANNVGEQNAIKEENLIMILNLDRRTIRKCIHELVTYEGDVKVICTGNNGVWVAASKREIGISASIDLKKALKFMAKFNSKMKKASLDSQLKIQFSRYEKPVREAYVHQDDNNIQECITTMYEDKKGQFSLPI